MPNNSESQCYFVQLQIDGFLDGDLSAAQQEVFTLHVQQCQACAREFHYAQTVQDAVWDLPLLDCDEQVLEPIHRLSAASDGPVPATDSARQSLASQIAEFIHSIPVFLRYGIPMAMLAVLAVSISTSGYLSDRSTPDLATQGAPPASQQATQDGFESVVQPGSAQAAQPGIEQRSGFEQLVGYEQREQYTAEELAQALKDLNLAIEYLSQVSQRTEEMIGGRFLISPLQDTFNTSFQRANIRQNRPLSNDPI